MDPARWHAVSQLFDRALRLPESERSAFLVEACQGDTALRAEVESLLAHDASAERLFDSAPVGAADELPAPGTLLGSYRIDRELGRGGMGVVFLAYDTTLHRRVAIKVVGSRRGADDARRRLLSEARSAAALTHPNICTIHEVGEAEGLAYIVMEYVEGQTMRERLDSGPLSPHDALAYGIQIADALAYAHDHGVIHRDCKAANVMVSSADRLKIVDFGLAKRQDAPSDAATWTTLVPAGVAAGTPAAMAPEQVRGEAADSRSDVWALGVLLYEMVAGRQPFRAPTVSEVFSAILRDSPASLPDGIPDSLTAIILKCLEKDPIRRYQHAREVRDALESAATAVAPPRRPVRHQLRAAAAITVATLVTAGILAVALDVGGVRTRLTGAPAARTFESLAVLPLESLGGGPEDDYFAAGMHEALIVGLGKLGGLRRVSARPSALRYRNTEKPLRQVASELGVDALITGTVFQSGDRVRITAHLIDPVSERSLWSQSYEREVRDVLALQNEVVAAIAREVRLQLSPDEQRALARTRAVNPEAYRAYLRGVFHLNSLTPEGLQQGMAALGDALTLDPAEPLAYAGLARGYSLMEVFSPSSSPDDAVRAAAAAGKALALDGTLAEAHLALATVKFSKEWDYAGAGRAFQRALQLNPNLAETHIAYAQYLSIFGTHDEALAAWQRGVELDPLSPLYMSWLAGAYWEFNRFDDAIEAARKATTLQADFPVALVVLGLAHLDKGQHQEAVAEHEKLLSRYPRQGNSAILARTYALTGRTVAARNLLGTLHGKEPADLAHPWFVASAHAALGDADEALNWLERAYDLRMGFLTNLGRERAAGFDLRPLRGHPRFQELLRKMNLTQTSQSVP